ncbi:ABC transporter ATP-binding protein [Spirochaetota bacterium]
MPLLNIKDLKIHYPVRSMGTFTGTGKFLKAVDGINLSLERGSSLGIVGESGCGKSTLARGIMRLVNITSGTLCFENRDITGLSKKELKSFRKNMQMIFQDPHSSLNPRLTAGDIISIPIKIFESDLTKGTIQKRVLHLIEKVGLSPDMIHRYPHEFSGGQKQRISIARSISINPMLLICDEPVSSLDVSIQAQIINLLNELKKTYNLTYIFISHDLAATRYIADSILVMYLGKVMEIGRTDEIINNPKHPYTKALISAVPEYNKTEGAIELTGEIPSPIDPPKGCVFNTRCPIAQDKCYVDAPELITGEDNHKIACHFS